jgi:hypothetical protein
MAHPYFNGSNITSEATSTGVIVVDRKPFDSKKTVGTDQEILSIDSLLTDMPNYLYDGMLVEDTDNSVTWQVYTDGTNWYKRIYDGMIHVKAVSVTDIIYPHGQTTVDGETITYGDIVFQVGGLPQLRGLWVYSADAPGQDNSHTTPCDGYIRHPLFDTVEDQLANVIIIADGGTVWKNSQWVCTTLGNITGCAEDLNGDAASPELLHWYYWAARPTDLGLGNEDYDALVGTAMSDSWLNFDPVSTQALGSTKYTEDANIGLFSYSNFVDASIADAGCDAYMSYDSDVGYIIANVNKEYLVQKVDSTDHFVAFYEDSGAGALPTSILIAKDDWCKTILYQNPADVEDVEFFTHSNRRCYQVTKTGITADGDTTVDIPMGYSVFTIKGVTNDANLDTFRFGVTSKGNELIEIAEFSSLTSNARCYGNLAVDKTADRSIYLTWRGVVATIALNAAGTGYTANDVITLVQDGSGGDATATVNTVDGGGAITGITLLAPGTDYFVANGLTVTGGTGNSATFDVTAITTNATEIDLTFVFYQDNF